MTERDTEGQSAVLFIVSGTGIMANGEPATVQGRRCDCMGLPLTCGNDEALGWYNKAIVAYFTLRENPVLPADKACELDDTLLLAHCFLVRLV